MQTGEWGMAVNVFEGARRITKIIIGLWLLAFVALYFTNPHPVEAVFDVSGPSSAPSLSLDDECGQRDHRQYDYSRSTPRGTEYAVLLCFKEQQFNDGRMLIPYRGADGMVYGDEPFSMAVTLYTQNFVDTWAVNDAALAWIDGERWAVGWDYSKFAAPWAFGGVVVIMVFSTVVGWVVRGFMGVPTGRDHRGPPASTSN